MPFTQYVFGWTVNTKLLGQWDPYSCKNQLNYFEVRIAEGDDDDNDDREAGYLQKRYESLNQYRISPTKIGNAMLSPRSQTLTHDLILGHMKPAHIYDDTAFLPATY